MPTYSCELCSKIFNKKTDFDRHKNRKIPCVEKSIEAIIEEKVEEKVEEIIAKKTSEKQVGVILNLVQSLHDLTRSKEAITGQKAYYDIIRLLLLRFMEPHIKPGGKLEDLLDPKHYVSINGFDPENVKYLHFHELCFDTELDFEDKIYLVWSMLSFNKFTTPVFPKNKAFNSPAYVLELACKKIYKTLENIQFDELDEDVGGAIYEHFVNKKGGGGGQSLGQYFTPRKLIQLIMRLNKELFPNHQVPKNIYDPCAGTAGFLMEMYKVTKVPPEEVYGGELEPDTFANCLMNIMLTTGSIGNVRNRDSFKNNSLQLYDWIGTNPPFGIKGLKYNDILENVEYKQEPVKKGVKQTKTCIPALEMYPIKTNDGSALFLQHCIAKLAINGMCNIVLPAGQLITGKNAYAGIRKHLIEECDLKAVLAVPGGVFDNAGVATVVLFFTKHKDTCTGDVEFYETDQSCTQINKLGTVHTEDLAEKNYILDWKYYKPIEVFKPIDSTWEIKTLGEVCEINFGTRIVKKDNKEGDYPVYGGGDATFTTFTYNREGMTCKISRFALTERNCVQILNGRYFLNDSGLTITTNDQNIMLDRYLWYYLLSIKSQIYEISEGAAQRNLNLEKLNALQIPIPSLEKQQEIISRCEEYDNKIRQNELLITSLEAQKQVLADVYVTPLFKDDNTKTLGEVCEMKAGKFNSSECKEQGDYPFYTGKAINPSGYGNKYCFDYENYLILIKDGGAGENVYGENIGLGKVFKVSGKAASTSHQLALIFNSTVSIDYAYYYLSSIKCKIMDLAHYTTGLGCITKEKLNALQIPIPSLEKQQEIVKKYDTLHGHIETTHDIITDIRAQKNQYLNDLFNGVSGKSGLKNIP